MTCGAAHSDGGTDFGAPATGDFETAATIDVRNRLTQAFGQIGGPRVNTVISIPKPGSVVSEQGTARRGTTASGLAS